MHIHPIRHYISLRQTREQQDNVEPEIINKGFWEEAASEATLPALFWKSCLSAERSQFHLPSLLLVPHPSLLLNGYMWIIFLCAFKDLFCVFFPRLILVFRYWPAPCLFGCLILIAMFVHDLLLPIRLKILHSGLCSSASLPLFYWALTRQPTQALYLCRDHRTKIRGRGMTDNWSVFSSLHLRTVLNPFPRWPIISLDIWSTISVKARKYDNLTRK